MIFVHSFQLLFRDCDYPKSFMWWIGFHAVLFWFLFWDFYKNTYLVRRRQTKLQNGEKQNKKQQAFFGCSQTETFINDMNTESSVYRRKNSGTSYSNTVKNGYTNGFQGAEKGKDL